MAGHYFAGDKGFLSVGWLNKDGNAQGKVPKKISHIQSWTINWSQQVYSMDALGFTDRVIYPGMRSLSGSARILYYRLDTTTAGSPDLATEPVSAILKRIMPISDASSSVGLGGDETTTASRELIFKLGYNSTADQYVRFTGFVTSFTMGCNIGEVSAADISFEANGAPTHNSLY